MKKIHLIISSIILIACAAMAAYFYVKSDNESYVNESGDQKKELTVSIGAQDFSFKSAFAIFGPHSTTIKFFPRESSCKDATSSGLSIRQGDQFINFTFFDKINPSTQKNSRTFSTFNTSGQHKINLNSENAEPQTFVFDWPNNTKALEIIKTPIHLVMSENSSHPRIEIKGTATLQACNEKPNFSLLPPIKTLSWNHSGFSIAAHGALARLTKNGTEIELILYNGAILDQKNSKDFKLIYSPNMDACKIWQNKSINAPFTAKISMKFSNNSKDTFDSLFFSSGGWNETTTLNASEYIRDNAPIQYPNPLPAPGEQFSVKIKLQKEWISLDGEMPVFMCPQQQ